jgi:hypothetical protein
MKNTLPIGIFIVIIIYLLYLMGYGLLLDDGEQFAAGFISFFIVLFLMGFVCLLGYGILNTFTQKIDWSFNINLKALCFDFILLFFINIINNYFLKIRSGIFSLPSIEDFKLIIFFVVVLLSWRIIALFFTK